VTVRTSPSGLHVGSGTCAAVTTSSRPHGAIKAEGEPLRKTREAWARAMAESFLTAEQLAERHNVGRPFVYEHAEELGAYRLGSGPRARLRFDLDEVRCRTSCWVSRESRAADPAPKAATRPSRRRRMAEGSNCCPFGAAGRGVKPMSDLDEWRPYRYRQRARGIP
jgi:hypothetical protein